MASHPPLGGAIGSHLVGSFIVVSGFGGETRGYAAYFTVTKISIIYPNFFRDISSRGNFRFRYPEDIQLEAVVLGTKRKKNKL